MKSFEGTICVIGGFGGSANRKMTGWFGQIVGAAFVSSGGVQPVRAG